MFRRSVKIRLRLLKSGTIRNNMELTERLARLRLPRNTEPFTATIYKLKGNNMQKSYMKRFFCTNCKEFFGKVFKFGEVAKQGECPNCGVDGNRVETSWEKRMSAS
jgi:hypothetical protein